MKNKKGEAKMNSNKLMVLLVVIVALSLVVDIIYLNTLYGLSKGEDGLEGSLAVILKSDEYLDLLLSYV